MASLVALTRARPFFSLTPLSKLLPPFTSRSVHNINTETYLSQAKHEQEASQDGNYSKFNQLQSAGHRGVFEVKRAEKELFIRVDMPGVSKDNIKVWVEDDSVFFRGFGVDDSDHKEGGRDYAGRFVCDSEKYKVSGVSAVLKNGALRMLVPKKEEVKNDDGVTQ